MHRSFFGSCLLRSLLLKCSCSLWRKDWLVEFDGDISLNMAGLRPLVDTHSDKALVLLKWYWKECQPWDCFMWECDDMLQNRTLSRF